LRNPHSRDNINVESPDASDLDSDGYSDLESSSDEDDDDDAGSESGMKIKYNEKDEAEAVDRNCRNHPQVIHVNRN